MLLSFRLDWVILMDFMLSVIIGIEPWTFVQNLGEAVFIPAGCPHQVRNLKVKLSGWICIGFVDRVG